MGADRVRTGLRGRVLGASFALVLVLLPTRAAHARGCTEVSDIVGEEKCSRFGDGWTLEGTFPISFRFGLRYSEVPVGGSTFSEQINKQKRPDGYVPYRYPGEALGVPSLSALGADGGFVVFLVHQLYAGMEGSFALGSASTASFTTTSGVALSDSKGLDVNIVHGGIPIGYRIPLGRAALRGEVMPGVVMMNVSHHVSAPGLPSDGSAWAMRPLLETRLAGDIWFTQHISFGVYGGVNVLDGDLHGRAFGASLAWHFRAFDGDSSF
jgi:hypothetical protein